MHKFITLIVYFFVSLCIFVTADDIFTSLKKLNLTPDQKKHVSTFKSQVFYRTNQTDIVKPRVEQNIIDMFNVTSGTDIETVSKLIRNTEFLHFCPQLVQAIDDISRSFPTKIEAYKIITEELSKGAGNRSEYFEQLSFSQSETWKIFMNWLIYRMGISEKFILSTLDEFPNTPEVFMKIQGVFSGPQRKDFLKSIVLDLGLNTTMENPPLSVADLSKRFPGLESTVKDMAKYKKSNHFVHVFLPYGLKREQEFLGLAIWLMFRIDSKEEETLKNEFPKLFAFRSKFSNEFKQLDDIAESMNVLWQIGNAYMNKK